MEGDFFSVIKLPRAEWDFYWNNIYLPKGMKYSLLRQIQTEYKLGPVSREFALSRTTVVHGPPGGGKTTGVKGACNEASKILNGEQCYFVELKFCNLSSQDYGESEKLITKAFKHIKEIASANCIIFILLDEVESILTDRKLTISPSNPVDAFRGVNAVLKELDDLSLNYLKVFCFATSNFLSTVDRAFIDRADRTFYIGLPDYDARLRILRDLCETMNKSIHSSLNVECSKFRELAQITNGISGRQLRKLPVETISNSDRLCKEPSILSFDDLIETARRTKTVSRNFDFRQNNNRFKNGAE